MLACGISLVFLAGVIGGLFLFFVKSYQPSLAILFYELFILSMLLWIITGGLGLTIMNGPWINVLNRIDYIEGILIVTSFLFFSFCFPWPKFSRSQRFFFLATCLVDIVLILLIIFTDLFVEKTTNWLDISLAGSFYPLYPTYFLILWLMGYGNLIRRYKEVDGFYRRLIKILLIGILFTSLLALPICFGSVLFKINWTIFILWLAYFSAVFWVGATLWILIRNRIGKA